MKWYSTYFFNHLYGFWQSDFEQSDFQENDFRQTVFPHKLTPTYSNEKKRLNHLYVPAKLLRTWSQWFLIARVPSISVLSHSFQILKGMKFIYLGIIAFFCKVGYETGKFEFIQLRTHYKKNTFFSSYSIIFFSWKYEFLFNEFRHWRIAYKWHNTHHCMITFSFNEF
jgi:hypothetical protein